MLRVISVARVHDTEWLIVSSSAIPPPCNGVCSIVLVPEREHVGLGGGAIPPPFMSLYSRYPPVHPSPGTPEGRLFMDIVIEVEFWEGGLVVGIATPRRPPAASHTRGNHSSCSWNGEAGTLTPQQLAEKEDTDAVMFDNRIVHPFCPLVSTIRPPPPAPISNGVPVVVTVLPTVNGFGVMISSALDVRGRRTYPQMRVLMICLFKVKSYAPLRHSRIITSGVSINPTCFLPIMSTVLHTPALVPRSLSMTAAVDELARKAAHVAHGGFLMPGARWWSPRC